MQAPGSYGMQQAGYHSGSSSHQQQQYRQQPQQHSTTAQAAMMAPPQQKKSSMPKGVRKFTTLKRRKRKKNYTSFTCLLTWKRQKESQIVSLGNCLLDVQKHGKPGKKVAKKFFPASKIQRKLKHSEEVQNDEFTFRSILQFFHGVLQPLQFLVERPENTVNKFLIEVRSGDAFSV